ncbi:MAG: cobaltochelatase subunit CobN, partial [Pseudomonadota bacterium]
MHLLQAQAGGIADGSEAVDLGQTPGDIIVLSAADTELASLAKALEELGETFPSLRLANLMQLSHNLSVDLYLDEVVAHAKLVIVRLLGGVGYWPYGVEQLADLCAQRGIALALLPGDEQPDAELAARCRLPQEACHRLWQYCVHGGPDNATSFLIYAASLIAEADSDAPSSWLEPKPLLRAGLYWPDVGQSDLESLRAQWDPAAPVAAILFYRALLQASNLAPIDDLVRALRGRGVNPLPIFCASLKEPVSAGTVEQLLRDSGAGLVLNGTGFAVSSPSTGLEEVSRRASPLEACGGPILQVVFSGGTEAAWRAGTQGLSARDIAMNVALPEVDGRLLSRAVSFKGEARYDPLTQSSIVTYQPLPDRIDFVARLAANWLALQACPVEDRRVAVVLANYPNRDGRLGNGVGLDTPAGTHRLLSAMAEQGYGIEDLPADGQALIERLAAGPTNSLADRTQKEAGERFSLQDYKAFFALLPSDLRDAVTARWGAPEGDPFVEEGAFVLSAFCLGKVIIGLQPARGYNIDPVSSYHDPDLVPPHGYLAFYAWLRQAKKVHAILHMGKHGNLEWLPGKAIALSESCFPEAIFGALPHLYPFIVNDPGEGTQAKRRAQAVIVDHLTPPLTRAESYGPLADLELLVDEYYEAAGVDPRRLKVLREEILSLTESIGLDQDCGIAKGDEAEEKLAKLDNYLCELKEMQIRDGLHIFGAAPEGDQLTDLLVALTRLPRGSGEGGHDSLLRALAADLGLTGFDPLDCDMGAPWAGLRPQVLMGDGTW